MMRSGGGGMVGPMMIMLAAGKFDRPRRAI